MYILTSSGRLIAGRNTVSDVEATLAEMRKGLIAYKRLSRAERLLSSALDPRTDKIRPSNPTKPPIGGLVLRMVSRTLPTPDTQKISEDDTRHPIYYKMDRVWYTRQESRTFLPTRLEAGEKSDVSAVVRLRLLPFNLGVFVQPNISWAEEDVRELVLMATITKVEKNKVTVQFAGKMSLKAERTHNRRRYQGNMLGNAVYDVKAKQFLRFELLALGDHTLGANEEFNTRATVPMGVYFTLNGTDSNDNVPPEFYTIAGKTP